MLSKEWRRRPRKRSYQTMWQGLQAKHSQGWQDGKVVPPLWERVGRPLQKLETAIWSSKPISGCTSRRTGQNLRDMPMFIMALFTGAKLRKQPEHPSQNEWIKKMQRVVCIHDETLFSLKKGHPVTCHTWMNLWLVKWNKLVPKGQILHDSISVRSLEVSDS